MVLAPDIGRLLIHMPKTSGIRWRAMLLATPGARTLYASTHAPATSASQALRKDLTTFGLLRPPSDWYRSLYLHIMRSDDRRRAMLAEWGGGSLDFEAVLAGWLSGDCPARLIHAPGILWANHPKRRFRWTQGEGLWANAMRYFFQNAAGDWLVDELVPVDASDATIEAMGLVPVPLVNARPADAPTLPRPTNAERARVKRVDGDLWREAKRLITPTPLSR
ncbi:MAG TPA: hypothetical protein VI911_07160 [Patescibacteria group bacterium]|nr:hypothetical protein [Patescibacteria group bacterium]